MRPTLMKETLKDLFAIQRTVCIEGAPGGGKTSVVQAVAKELQVPYIEQHMATMLVEDFGVPDVMSKGDSFGYKMPEWYPYKGKPGTERGGILCFDDRNQADADLQKVLANIVQARTLHRVPMADGWQVISTGNRAGDRAGAKRVLSHLRDRETVLELDTHLDDWTGWAIDNGVAPEVISFLRFRPGLLHAFDPQADNSPTPRGWVDGVSAVLGVISGDAEYECFKGAVGEGAAAEFVGYVRIFRKLPSPDAVMLNPTAGVVPTDAATLYALSGALAGRASVSNCERFVTYLERIRTEVNKAEFGVLAMSMALRRDPEIAHSSGFTKWAVNNQSVLF